MLMDQEECGLRVEATSLRPRAKILIVRPVPEGPPVLAQLFVFTCSGLGEVAEYVRPWLEDWEPY